MAVVLALAIAIGISLLAAVNSLPGSQPSPEVAQIMPPRPAPLIFLPLSQNAARDRNQRIPFRPLGPAARPFFQGGTSLDRGRGLDCLSAAMWFEAGDDARGQYAVAQVVLNRVRHPAFPNSICAVVFEGSERVTGCQFTFTCDGALVRVPPLTAMARARARAEEMLRGRIASEVGLATHYHTDWVQPAWSPEMEKIAQVGTHLFFRWGNGWGGPSVMRRSHADSEPIIPRLAALFPAHQRTDSLVLTGENGSTTLIPGIAVDGSDPSSAAIAVTFTLTNNPGVQALAAFDKCGDRPKCAIIGYLESVGSQRGPVVFMYQRDRDRRLERVQWDCERFKRPSSTQCMPRH